MVRISCLQQSQVTDSQWEKRTRWIYYDREKLPHLPQGGLQQQVPDRADRQPGRDGLAALHRVPMFQMKRKGLWLMNKAALLQLEHFKQSNALSWALTMGLFATPVIYSDRERTWIVAKIPNLI